MSEPERVEFPIYCANENCSVQIGTGTRPVDTPEPPRHFGYCRSCGEPLIAAALENREF